MSTISKIIREIQRPFMRLCKVSQTDSSCGHHYPCDEQDKALGKNTWKQDFQHSQTMSDRIRQMVALIDFPYRSLMDLGCGMQECKKLLPDCVTYYPIDIHQHLPTTIVKDLNAGEFLEVPVDVILVSGVFEYIYDLKGLIEKICRHSDCVICSYCNTNDNPDRLSVWVNHLTNTDFIALLEGHGFRLSKDIPKSEFQDHLYLFSKTKCS